MEMTMMMLGGNSFGARGGDHAAGTKRKADESSLGDSDRFFKRFNLLSLAADAHGHASSNCYIAVPPSSTPEIATCRSSNRTPPSSQDESMQVDDTPDRVYIHDLDEELADLETEEPRLIFLPDIEKQLSRIPQQVLMGKREDDHEGQELVLYGVPKSLTVDEGHDSVRKAILETRQRAREKAAEEARQRDMDRNYDQSDSRNPAETAHGYGSGYAVDGEADLDAMDMD